MRKNVPTLKASNKPLDNASLSGTARLIDYLVGFAPDAIKYVAFSDKSRQKFLMSTEPRID